MQLNEKYDCIIVLAHLMIKTKDGWTSDEEGLLRLNAAVKLYRKRIAPIIVLSGGKIHGSKEPSLAQVMFQDISHLCKFPAKSVIIEEKSYDTSTNAENVEKIIKSRGWKHILLITNKYHLRRARVTFQMYGLKVKGLSAEDVLGLTPTNTRVSETAVFLLQIPAIGSRIIVPLIRWFNSQRYKVSKKKN